MSSRMLFWIAYRYFRSKKRTALISLTSYISVFGIAIGAFALLITLSILNGFEEEISKRVIDLESHIRISGSSSMTTESILKINELLSNENVDVTYPYILKKSVLSTRGIDAVVRLKGVDSTVIATKILEKSTIIRGNNYFHAPTSDLPGIILGYRLADKLGLFLGDTVNVINPLDIRGSYNIPYVGQFALSGIFRLELFDYDENLAFVEISQLQRIFKMPNQYSGIDIRFDSYKNIPQKKTALQVALPTHTVKSWADLHRDLFGAMKLEKYGSFLALCFIILIAIFNLTSSLVMLVMEKIREIGMLQTLGMNNRHIKGIFLRLGFITGTIGLVLGLTLSLILCLSQQYFQYIPLPSVYFIPYLPVEVHLLDVLAILVSGCILIYLGTVYPSQRVGGLAPLEAIQYEK